MKKLYIVTVGLLLFISACRLSHEDEVVTLSNRLLETQFNHHPHLRLGSCAAYTLGTHFLDTDHLGRHNYQSGRSEKNGIVYTVKAGHIDISHVREAADWTVYLAAMTYRHLLAGDFSYSFKLKEGSICYVHLI